jgi:hypothetical protein
MQKWNIIDSRNNCIRIVRYFYDYDDDNKPLLCYTVEHSFHIPHISVTWLDATSQTRKFATYRMINYKIVQNIKQC